MYRWLPLAAFIVQSALLIYYCFEHARISVTDPKGSQWWYTLSPWMPFWISVIWTFPSRCQSGIRCRMILPARLLVTNSVNWDTTKYLSWWSHKNMFNYVLSECIHSEQEVLRVGLPATSTHLLRQPAFCPEGWQFKTISTSWCSRQYCILNRAAPGCKISLFTMLEMPTIINTF